MGPWAWDVKKWCVFSLHVFFFFCKRLSLLPKLIFTQREQCSPEEARVRSGGREWTKRMMGSEERTLTPSRDSPPPAVSYGPDHVALLRAHYRWGRGGGRRRSRERRLRVKPTDLIHSLLIGRRAAFSSSRTYRGGGFSCEAFLALYLLHLVPLADDLTVRSDTKSER